MNRDDRSIKYESKRKRRDRSFSPDHHRQRSRSRSPRRNETLVYDYDTRDVRDIRNTTAYHEKRNINKTGKQTKTWPTNVPPSRVLGIFNIDYTVTEKELRSQFEQYGEIESFQKIQNRNYAFVYYRSIESATNARWIMNGLVLGKLPIRVDYSTTDKRKEERKEK